MNDTIASSFRAIALLCLFLLASQSVAGHATPLEAGAPFPDITLQGQFTSPQKAMLGLEGDGPFRLSDVKARHVLIEVFSMYCPHCQREAPDMNRLSARIADMQPRGELALLGLGAGNTQTEVDLFRETYGVPFPLAIDPDLEMHKALGEPGTPHFFLVSLRDRGKPVVLISRTGRMSGVDDFIRELRTLCGSD